jgi:DNA-binding NtrC family response regulator
MSDDFISMKLLIVSEAAPERELLRRASAEASIPVDVSELDAPGDPVAMRELLARQNFDGVFFDSRIAKPARQELLDAIHSAASRPLAILIAPATIKTREVFTDGLEVDGALAKPMDLQEARDLIGCCIRARLPQRVLVVDDSSTVRSVVRKVLQASRCKLEAEEAADGSAAVELAKKQRFDIVFLDCQMPGLDGFATLGMLKAAHPDMKVVMMTGTKDHRIEDRARTEGAKDFLFKPFFAKDIDAVLHRLFGLAKRS